MMKPKINTSNGSVYQCRRFRFGVEPRFQNQTWRQCRQWARPTSGKLGRRLEKKHVIYIFFLQRSTYSFTYLSENIFFSLNCHAYCVYVVKIGH